MRIGIIGTGRIASGVAQRLVKAGHEVYFGSRNTQKAQAAAQTLGAQGGSQEDAVSFGDVIFLAVPFSAVQEVARSLPGLRGKIVIETTNNLAGGSTLSSTEQIQAWLPDSKVIKAFNHIFAPIIANDPAADLARSAAFIVGDDKDAKQITAQVIASMGFDVIDAGGVKNAVHMDNLAKFIIELGYGLGYGTSIAYQIVNVV